MNKKNGFRKIFIVSLAFLTMTGCTLKPRHQIETQIYDNEFTVDSFEKSLYNIFDFEEKQLTIQQKQIPTKGRIDAKDFNFLKDVDCLVLIDKPVIVQKSIYKYDEWNNYVPDTENLKLGNYTFVYTIFSCEGTSYLSPYHNKNGKYLILDDENNSFIEIQGNMTCTYNYDYNGNGKENEHFVMNYDFAVEKGYIEDVKDYYFD